VIPQGEAERVRNAGIVTEGHRFTLIAVAMAKHVLAHYRIAAGERLKIHELLDGCVDFNLTAGAIAAVAPASLPFLEIVMEAGKLDPRSTTRGSAARSMTKTQTSRGLGDRRGPPRGRPRPREE
jgi:hypothetical protein